MEGLFGGLYGLVNWGGKVVLTLLIGRESASKSPNFLRMTLAGGLLGGASSIFVPPLPGGPFWPVGILIGIVASVLLMGLNSICGGDKDQ
jgi:uncharacterized membrane protein YccC